MSNSILITGITDLDCYPSGGIYTNYKQNMFNNIVCIPKSKPDIESINEIKVDIDIEEFKVIKSILGPKLLIYGCVSVKIIYTADNCQQSVHSAHWNKPFCDFVLLKDLSYEVCKDLTMKVFLGVEDVCIKYFNQRVIDLSILYVICPQIILPNTGNCYNKHDHCQDDLSYCNETCGYKQNIYSNFKK